MNIVRIEHNANEMAAFLDAVGRRQIPFATANGINRTLDEIQLEARRKLPSQFRFKGAKGKRFFEQLIHIRKGDRARKDRLVGIVGIQDPEGDTFAGKAKMLARFQQAGVKRGPAGGPPIAIPTSYFSKGAAVPQRYYPSALGLVPYRQISGEQTTRALYRTRQGKYLFRGKLRTYAVDPYFHNAAPRPTWGVWQRRGRGRNSEIFLLWVYRRQIKQPKRISFPEDATALAKQRLGGNVEGQMRYARDEVKQERARAGEKAARLAKRI